MHVLVAYVKPLLTLLRTIAGEGSVEGMQSPRSACSALDAGAWPTCGDAAELLHLYASAWEQSCVLWRRRAAAWAL